MTLTNRSKIYENVPGWANVVSRARNQRDIVDQLATDEKTKVDEAYVNMGLKAYQDWNDRPEVLKNSIILALKAHTNTKDVMMVLFDEPVRPVAARLMGKLVELSRKEIADQIADQLLQNPKAVGFQLSLKNDTEYELNMLVSTNNETRSEKFSRYESIVSQVQDCKQTISSVDETSDDYLKATATLEALKEENTYSPVYIIRYDRA